MRRSTRKSSIGVEEEQLNSNQIGSFSTRFSLSYFVKRVEKLTNDQKNAINKVGFGNLLLIPNQMLSKNLLVELMERWNSEEHGFMLLPGVIKIKPMDVSLILGIRVTGDPVLLRDDEAFSDLESDYGATSLKRKITVASLESRLDSLGEVVNEDFVRTFILFMFGTLLFPNANGKVDSRYLCFLKNLDNISNFSWGAAVLEDLHMWLNKKKESNVQYVGGCLILLQIWSYEHIDLARPDLIDTYLKFPRACCWENSRSHQRQWFTAKFKELQDHQITWKLQPTTEELEFDFVNELLEVESSSIDNSSDGDSVVVVDGLRIESDTLDLQVQQRKDASVNSKQSKVSQDIPEVQTKVFQSTPCVSVLNKEHVELSSKCLDSEKWTKGEVKKGQEDYFKQSTASQYTQDVPIETKEFPEKQSEDIDYLSMACASELHKDFVDLSSRHQNSEKFTSGNVVDELHTESEMTNVSKLQDEKGQEINLKLLTTSQHILKMQADALDFPSTSCVSELEKSYGSEKFMINNEDELIKRNQILEVQNMELRKEIEALKVENRQLKLHICSTNDLMTRLESLVMDDNTHHS